MTVSSVVVRAAAAWTGAETEIPTGIQVQERSQLVVSLVPDEGERQALTLGLHYAITLSPAGVATVVPLVAFPATPGTVSMVRQTPMTQVYDPTATDTYDAAGHAAALDRSAMRVAELSQKVDDIEQSSIVVAGGAASVPVGAVYVSNGEGGAVAGPTAAEIETARVDAVSAAGTATGAAGLATGAATAAGSAAALANQLANAEPGTPVGGGFSAKHWAAVAQALSDAFDLDAYSTTEQIAAMLQGFVPTARKLKVGAGLSIDGADGSDAVPAEIDLSSDRLIRLAFATPAETIAGALTGKPVDPAGLAAAIAALAGGGPSSKVVQFAASGNYTPSQDTRYVFAVLVGGGGGRGGKRDTSSYQAGGIGGAGAIGFGFIAVDDGATYPVAVGAAGSGGASGGGNGGTGGTTSITVGGVTYAAAGGVGGTGTTSTSAAGAAGASGSVAGPVLIGSNANNLNRILGAAYGAAGIGANVNAGLSGGAGIAILVEFGA